MAEQSIGQRLQDQMNSYSLAKWGFVLMRCTYGDDEAWDRLMQRLNAYMKNHFDDSDEVDVQVWARHDWSVQEDPALEGASKDAIRQRFKQWLDTDGKAEYASPQCPSEDMIKREIPRYSFCLAIDRASMDSILADPFHIFEGYIVLGRTAYVNVLRADDDWYRQGYPDFSTFDWSQYTEDDNESLHWDERAKEIEGCRLHDVGWMKCRLFDLGVELWRLFSGSVYQWDYTYVRPDRGMALR